MEPSESLVRPRKPWLALVLSLVITGLGQIYNGQWKKGVLFFLAETVCGVVFFFAFASFAGMLGAVLALIVFNLFVAGEAFVSARRLNQYSLKPCNRWWIYGAILCLSFLSGLAFEDALGAWFYKTYQAPSGSMLPTVRIGDHFMVEMLSGDAVIERGDIIVFRFPEDETKDFIKRVIGLPGETVEMSAKQVLVNGKPLDEPYVQHTKPSDVPGRDNFSPVSLGQGEYFVMGDNREASYDSRFWGPVGRSAIFGRTQYLYFPADMGSSDWFERLGMELR